MYKSAKVPTNKSMDTLFFSIQSRKCFTIGCLAFVSSINFHFKVLLWTGVKLDKYDIFSSSCMRFRSPKRAS